MVRESSRKVEAGGIVQRVESTTQGPDMILSFYAIGSLGRFTLRWLSQEQTQGG